MPATRTRWSPSISGRKAYAFAVASLIAVALAASVVAQRDLPTRALLESAIDEFLAGRVKESVVIFDRVAVQAPEIAPELWQRGIALYYAGRDRDCRAQFESHRTVNPNDVENAAWHFLCVSRAESPAKARAALLPVGPDPRVPMRQIYEMFRGTLSPEQMLQAAGSQATGQFYAQLYAGLYFDAQRDDRRALEHITAAAADRYADAGGYMHTVAKVHLGILKLSRSGPKAPAL